MPTPVQTLQAVRSAALTNAAALQSVATQAAAHIVDVEAMPLSPGRGMMLDQLRRLMGDYQEAKAKADATVALATRIIGTLGPDPGPGPDPAPVVWSTGSW